MLTTKTPTVCLVMIVRNEAPRMPRLLETISSFIDEVVISDTGSTDNTIEVTREYCNGMGVRCVVDETPFKDFGFNRSRSITVAIQKSDCDYLLFLDADMKIVLGPGFTKQALLGSRIDVMSLMQKGCGLEYYNMRLMRRCLPGLKCVGVTHEHYACDGGHSSFNVPGDLIYIDDIGDGGSKSDKFERDFRLLTKGLIDEPTNVRYMFYLAETCRHSHKFEESIKFYKMRIKAGGWDEEIYRSMYGVTMCYMAIGRADKVDSWAIRAHLYRPSRVESIYAACKWHREKGENSRAYALYQLGSRVARPMGDVLFVETSPYNWAWDYEFAILAYYVERSPSCVLKNPMGSMSCLRKIISALGTSSSKYGTVIPDFAYRNIIDNINHYVDLLPSSFVRSDVQTSLIPGFTSSTPAIVNLIVKSKRGYKFRRVTRIVRHVDYKIKKEDGSYIYSPDGTVNSRYTIQSNSGEPWKDLKFDYSRVTTPEYPPQTSRIKDIEDIRLFNLQPEITSSATSDDGIVYGLGSTVQYSTDGRAAMMLIEVDINNSIAYPIKRLLRINDWEKNHAPINGTNYCVHSWGPRLRIYDLVKSTASSIVFTHDFPETELPGWFRELRGSTCGIPLPSVPAQDSSQQKPQEYWFLVHSVVHTSPRRYMHSVVRLDAVTLKPVGFTAPFSFDDYHVEFAGGIAFEDNDQTLVASYSVFDSTSREIRIPISWLNQNLMITALSGA